MAPSSSLADLPGRVLTVPDRPPWGRPVRIGDAERETAITTLGDHFAAGRLDREELDERISSAVEARYEADLEPLFADLPRSRPLAEPSTVGWSSGARKPPRPLAALAALALLIIVAMIIVGMVIVGMVIGLVIGAPWLLWGVAWVLVMAMARGRPMFGHPRPARSGCIVATGRAERHRGRPQMH